MVSALPWPIALVVLGALGHHALMRWLDIYARRRLQRAEVEELGDQVKRFTDRVQRLENKYAGD